MLAGVIALILTGLGALLIVWGVIVSLSDRKRRLAAQERPSVRPTAGGIDLEGLAKLAEALGNKPVGFQMMIIGTVLMLAGGVSGGVSSL